MELSLTLMMVRSILQRHYYLQTKELYMLNINQQLDNGQPILISTILLLNLMDIFMILSFYVLIILKPLSLLLRISNK
jgi:hypothetical protein